MSEEYGVSHMPDVLNCLADLSNDEVFTPPDVANAMLDLLPEDIWQRDDVRFLDPCCKTGVFLREITKRLLRGQLPDFDHRMIEIEDKRRKHEPLNSREEGYLTLLQATLDHILKEQVYGIAITELTALMTRRTLYCAKYADSEFSVVHFDNPDGNIRYVPLEHEWEGKKGKEHCKWCGVSKNEIENRTSGETYAYELIHTAEPERLFNVKIDVIVSNPPYNLNVGQEKENYGVPIYDKFVRAAKRFEPEYMSMIVPARWYAGGRGLDDFRDEMLHDKHISRICDYPNSADCFSNAVEIQGGVCYFLWEREHDDDCIVKTFSSVASNDPMKRPLLEENCTTFLRYNEAVSIIRKVLAKEEKCFGDLVSPQTPFGVITSYKGIPTKEHDDDLKMYISGNEKEYKGGSSFCPMEKITKGHEMIPWHKVYIGAAYGGGMKFPHSVIGKPFYGEPNSICNQSYLCVGPFDSKETCLNVMSYYSTKFMRFLILQKKNAQHAMRGVYQFVPQQDWSHIWTDEMLYEKYELTPSEIEFIEALIKPMELGGDND